LAALQAIIPWGAALVALLVIAVVAVWLQRRRIAFSIKLVDGHAGIARGQPPEDFVTDVQRIADFSGLKRGTIHGMRGRGGKVTLHFRGIARGNQWQFKNAWRNPI